MNVKVIGRKIIEPEEEVGISLEEEKPITRTNEVQQEDSGNSAEQMQEASVSAE